jgi:hypothetical protein
VPQHHFCQGQHIGKPITEDRAQGHKVRTHYRSRTAKEDTELPSQIGKWFSVRSMCLQSMRGAVAIRSGIALRSSGCGTQPLVAVPGYNLPGAAKAENPPRLPGCEQRPLQFSGKPSAPNPSLNRTSYGRPPWPGLRYAVHCLSPGQGVLPPLAG